MKRFVCLFVCMALCFMVVSPAYAAHITADDEARIVGNQSPEPVELSENQSAQFDVYEVDIAQIREDCKYTDYNAINIILSLCEESKITTVDNKEIMTYNSTLLQNYLSKCQEITDISMSNGLLYIFYCGVNNEHVILCYNEEGLYQKNVYDPKADTLVRECNDTVYLCNEYQNGTYVQMNETMVAEIDRLRNEGKWEEIDNIEGIKVTFHSDGTHTIEPETDFLPTSAGATTTAQLLADLKASFPSYTKKLMKSYTKYSAALSSYVVVLVYESRDGYTRESAVGKFFEALVSNITDIGTYLNITSLSDLYGLAAALNIVYDITGALVEAVTVYRKADYTYRLSRYGYAFDSTVYDEYVRVFEHGSGGIFAGGYDSDEKDNFVWVITLEPSTEAYSYDSISNTTIHNYNADIAMHQYCTLYYPD